MEEELKKEEMVETSNNKVVETTNVKATKKKKLINGKLLLKNYIYWFITIVYLESVFKVIMNIKFSTDSIINILIYAISAASIISLINSILTKKTGNVYRLITSFTLGVLFSVQCVFHKILTTYFSVSNLLIADQATDYMDKAMKEIFVNIGFILLFLIPFIFLILFKKKISYDKPRILDYIVYILIFALSFAGLIFYVNSSKNDGNTSSYHVYYEVNETELSINKFGVLNAYRLDVSRLLFGFKTVIKEEKKEEKPKEDEDDKEDEEEKVVYTPNTQNLNFDKNPWNNDIATINNYVQSDTPTMKNEYTGMFEGYNIVYITAESFYDIAIDPNVTPTLYKLTHSGFIFTNFYAPYVLSTIGGELQSLTGLFPDNSILAKWREGTNYFPYGLGGIFGGKGYNTFAYHNNNYAFQDRHQYLPSQGFTNYIGCYNGMERRINCRIWPQSDDQMIEATIPDYIDSEQPFLAYYMTVSGHFEYNFNGDNTMSMWNKEKALELERGTTNAKAYVATQIELDKALARLIAALEEKGKLDKTVFVMLADHYPYDLSMDDINSLSTYQRDDTVEVNHNALILWNSNMETTIVNKVCQSVDVLPTVLNLFGIDYDSRLLTGRDILSDAEGLAIMKNHSWVTDKGTYFASTGTFVPKEGQTVEDGYADNISTRVNNRLNISRMIIANNYYNYLFN